MPRDGLQQYSPPPGTNGITNYTIESTKYNGFVADVTQDLNLPRPIVAGGTGANNAVDARFNLAAETATQIVTNYDTQLWTPGSFQSAVGATGAPNSTSVFAGICYIGEALANPPTNQNVVVEARDISSPTKPGPVYTRQKTAGTWSSWGTSGGGAGDASNRQAIYAAPFDALAYNGMQVNGSMEVSQELGTTGTVTHGAYALDGYMLVKTSTAGATGAQVIDTVTFPGFQFYALINVGVAGPATPAAGDIVGLQHRIEGYRIVRLAWGKANAQPITIGFWHDHARAGTYSVAVRGGGGGGFSYVTTYQQVSAGVPEYAVVTISGPTVGTWETTNLAALFIEFTMASGTTKTTSSLNTWVAGDFRAATGQANGVAATTDRFRITGVIVLPGIEAPSAARSALIMRPYDQELVTCQRYFWIWRGASFGIRAGLAYADTTTSGFVTFNLPSQMRTSPTVNSSNMAFNGVIVSPNPAATISANVLTVSMTGTGLTVGANQFYPSTGGGFIVADARL